MSWLFSQALVAEYSPRTSWGGEPSAQLNVMPTLHKFWRNDKTMEFCDLSRFGLTLQVLTASRGTELLTLYQADFHAKTLAPQAKAQVLTENVQDCGQKWLELSVKYDLDTCSWKTHQCLFQEDLPESSVTLPKWGFACNGLVFQHPTLERPINVTDFGLLPTPTATDYKRNGYPGDMKRKSPSLGAVVQMYPTPKATDGNKRGKVSPHHQNGLAGAVKSGHGGGVLNPDWVEWLMGFPIGWTDLNALEMHKFLTWQKAHTYF